MVVYALFILVIYSHAALTRRQFILRRSYLEVAGRVPPGPPYTTLSDSLRVYHEFTLLSRALLKPARRGQNDLDTGNFNIRLITTFLAEDAVRWFMRVAHRRGHSKLSYKVIRNFQYRKNSNYILRTRVHT